MSQKKILIKNKIINHLQINGKKYKGEKILIQTVKELQKSTVKPSRKLIKLALVVSSPIFKIHEITQKKRKKKKQKTRIIPAFIYNKSSRISFSIKYIIKTAEKNNISLFFFKLKEEFLLTAQYKSDSIEKKQDLQKRLLTYKHLFKYYRWH